MSQHVSAYNVLQLPTTQNDSPSMEESIVFWIRMSLQVGSFQDPWQHWVCCQALQWSWNGFTQRRANYYIYEHHQCWTCVHISLSLSLSLWYWYVCARPLSVPGWYGRATEYVHILLHDVPFSYMSLLAGSLEQRHPNNTKVSNVHCGFSSILRSSFSMILCWWSILGKLWKRYRSRCIRIINQTPGHSPSGCRSKVVTATWSTQKGTCWSSRREPGAKAFPVSSGQAASSDELFVDHTVLRAICAWCTYTCV